MMHRITVDRRNRLIHFTITGFADAERSRAFDADLRACVRDLAGTGPSFDVLADLRDVSILPQALAELTGHQMLWVAKHGLRKAANILSSALYVLQLKRIARDPRFEYFTTEVEARKWLNE